MVIAYSYIRFSCKRQARGDSERRQKGLGVDLAARRGWQLDDSLSLEDLGISARRSKNAEIGALGAFLEAVKAGKVKKGSVLIVESLDRLSRDHITEAVELFMGILRLGVIIATTDPEREYSKQSLNDQPFTLFEPILIFIRANEENERRANRLAACWEGRRLKAGESNRPMTAARPPWIKFHKGAYSLIPERAAIVQRIFTMYLAGNSLLDICKAFNSEGVPRFGKCAWDPQYLGKIMRGRLVLGELQPTRRVGGKRIPAGKLLVGYYPAVVSEDVWYRAQAKLANRTPPKFKGRRGSEVANLFGGILRNARDGTTMRMRVGVKPKTEEEPCRRWLVSNAVIDGREKTPYQSFQYAAIEAAFLHFIREVHLDPPTEANRARLQAEIETLEGQAAEANDRIRQVQQVIIDGGEIASLAEVLRRLEEGRRGFLERIDQAKAQLEEDVRDTLTTVRTLADQLQAAGEAGEVEQVRSRLRNKIRDLVAEMWILVEGERYRRTATIQVFFKAGGSRYIQIDHHNGRHKKALSFVAVDNLNLDLRKWREVQ